MSTNPVPGPAPAAPAPPQAPQAPPPPLVPAPFALSPSDIVGAAAYIDYSTADGRKAYFKAIEPLTTQYEGSQKGLHWFIHQVEQKALAHGWHDTLINIPVGIAVPGVIRPTYSLFDQYGQITIDDLRAHAATYIGQFTSYLA
jgi:hypothetical protein